MKGISSAGKEQINSIVEEMFNNLAVHLVGNLPKYRNKKIMTIGQGSRQNLASLFVQSMSNRQPNEIEKDLLKGLLESASEYIDALKSKTKANIIDRLDGIARESNLKNQKLSESQIQDIIAEEMSKSKSHLIKIAEAESSKIRNTGVAVNITRAASDVGVSDPNVYFVVVRDENTCKWCLKNHLMSDGITPKVFKMSQVKQSYLSSEDRKNGEISLSGQHPHCRCSIVYLSTGFGFKNGLLEYKSQEHDEYQEQNS